MVNIKTIIDKVKDYSGYNDLVYIIKNFKKTDNIISHYDFDTRSVLNQRYQDALNEWNACMYKIEHWENVSQSEIDFLCEEANLINKKLHMIKNDIVKMGNIPYRDEDMRCISIQKKIKRFK